MGFAVRNYVCTRTNWSKMSVLLKRLDVDGVMNGNIDRFLKAFLMQQGESAGHKTNA